MAEKAREVSGKLHKWLTEEMGYQGPQRYGPFNEMNQSFFRDPPTRAETEQEGSAVRH